MADIPSWAWLGTGNWPGFSTSWLFGTPNSQDYLRASGNGLTINPNNYTNIIWRDGNNDGIINDNDSGDGTTAGSDRVLIGSSTKTVHEVANYNNSTVVIKGTTYQVNLSVWLFTDGSYMVRMSDADIPAGTHYSTVSSITLGQWDGAEYSGSYIESRDDPFLCFTSGTLIDTPDGPRPLRWTGRREVAAEGRHAPVLIRAGALGNKRDLLLSPQHRLLLSDWRAALHAGSDEVLVAALHLVNGDTISRWPGGRVCYIHLLFDDHEIVWAEGIPTESFHPAAYGIGVLDEAARREVLELFPELDTDLAGYGPTARACLRSWEARAMRAS